MSAAMGEGALEFTILGCGSSGGVPRADGAWGACDPTAPRNHRSRCSFKDLAASAIRWHIVSPTGSLPGAHGNANVSKHVVGV